MKQSGKAWSGLSATGITAFFLCCFLALVLFGTNIYRSTAASRQAGNEMRASLSYLHTVSRSNEAGISAGTGEYGDMLVVADGNTGYGNRIYVYEGYLVEDYSRLSAPLLPDSASQICENSLLQIEAVRQDLLKVTVDEGTVYLHIRGKGGAE